MNVRRILRHLMAPSWRLRQKFPQTALSRIEKAVADSELRHQGQIRFAVEHALDAGALLRSESARERALEVFSALRVWDTEHNNGVLIYVLLADRDVEIIADRGIHGRVSAREWEEICRAMEGSFRAGRFEAGVLQGIEQVSRLLACHYPRTRPGYNELPDRPAII